MTAVTAGSPAVTRAAMRCAPGGAACSCLPCWWEPGPWAGRGGVPVPGLLLHLAGDRARRVRPGLAYVGSSHLPWLGPRVLRRHPVDRRTALRPADLQPGTRSARARGARGDDRCRRQRRPDKAAGQRRQGGRLRAVHRRRRVGGPGEPDRADRLRAGPSSAGQWVRLPENRLAGSMHRLRRRGRHLRHVQRAGHRGVLRRGDHPPRVRGRRAVHRHAVGHGRRRRRDPVPRRQAVPVRLPGSASFFSSPCNYVFVAVLAELAAHMGVAFKNVLYKIEDWCDALWKGRPEWARPVAGGLAFGLLLLALPQMYGVGYPVMFKATAGNYALWFLIVLKPGEDPRPACRWGSAAPAASSPRRCSSASPSATRAWVTSRTTTCSAPEAGHGLRCTRWSRWARCSPPPPAPR